MEVQSTLATATVNTILYGKLDWHVISQLHAVYNIPTVISCKNEFPDFGFTNFDYSR